MNEFLKEQEERNYWLQRGIQSERERIIKLLEQDICLDWTVTCCDGACAAYKDAIALIKGD